MATKKPAQDKSEKAPKKVAAKAEGTETKSSKTKQTVKTVRKPLLPKTPFAKHGENTQWLLVDVAGLPVGRVSSVIAQLLMGKHKPLYTRHADTGDSVVVINASKAVFTGKKWEQKLYQHHTNYPGGLKTQTAQDIRETNPEKIIEKAVYRMLPKYKGHMVRRWNSKLFVYAETEHPHKAQKPAPYKLPNLGAN